MKDENIGKQVLVVEDDMIVFKIISSVLNKYGFNAVSASNGREALEYLKKSSVDAIILDLNLPDIHGIEILKIIRNHPVHNSVAILVVTSSNDKMEEILSLEVGADDYIVKPFHHRELIARLNAILRRTKTLGNRSNIIIFDDIKINIEKRLVKKGDKLIKLSFKEFEILLLLTSNPGKVISREAMLNKIGGLRYVPDTRTIDMHISAIRKKLGDTERIKKYIDTITGVGYRFRDICIDNKVAT
ncbi:response regulator transcription factor [Maledivibacter halophilus]|uniref:Stage 0 sporulation protein A homolog n=1 Tax=Maledivibacter halophilus TaxID=36842 RepID=A0A1T5L457_9FIRM|nr:response regulator transcription factor [Maledivibacter halophilus]SKC70817.1 two-component system, OmpR family, alkaline phosphatase synthesis response regulator PhoP [Maledivibacter halophilus]